MGGDDDADEARLTRVDLNSGMLEALRNPPPGFRSRYSFTPADIRLALGRVPWFQGCGGAPQDLAVTPPMIWVTSWKEAAEVAAAPSTEEAFLEAQNQLTLWLSRHARSAYQDWNQRVALFKADVLEPLRARWLAHQERIGVGDWLVDTASWHVLGAAMENEYLSLHHPAVFFLELLRVYEAGRFPCGWRGR